MIKYHHLDIKLTNMWMLIILFVLLSVVDTFYFNWIKIRQECFFVDLNRITYKEETFDLSKLHFINSTKKRGRIKPFVKDYMAFYNSTEGIYWRSLDVRINRATLYRGRFSQYFSLYVGFDASFVYNEKHYRYVRQEDMRFAIPGPCVGNVDDLIVLGTNYTRENFGHSLQDFFHSLILIPENVRKQAKVLMTIVPVLYEVVELLGFNKSQEVFLNKGEWIYASHVYTIDHPAAHLTIFGEVAVEFIEFMREKLGVYKIKPDSYYFSNRVKGTGRHIINFDEIVELTKKSHPEIAFKYLHDRIDNIWEGAKIWGTVKFLYTPPGSNVIKTYFMNEYAVIVTPLGKFSDPCLQILNALGKVFVLHYYVSTMVHDRKTSCYIDPQLSLKVINMGLECCMNRRWPDNAYTYKNIPKKKYKKIIGL